MLLLREGCAGFDVEVDAGEVGEKGEKGCGEDVEEVEWEDGGGCGEKGWG